MRLLTKYQGKYTPPSCKFNRVAMKLTVVSKGVQFDRLAVMFLGDIEVWRTSTAEPNPSSGIAWTYWKDMSLYSTLWKTPQRVIFDMGNVVDDTYTAQLNMTLTATFYHDSAESFGAKYPDKIMAISRHRGHANQPSYFHYPSDTPVSHLSFDKDVVRAVVSIAATGQANEEFWWANISDHTADTYTVQGRRLPDKGSFREVRLFIDGKLAGLVWPFPVVLTGGISPALNRPIVGIQAFDMLEAEIDVSPFLGVLCDGKDHEFKMQVVAANNSAPGSYWVLSGKVFTWTDELGRHTKGGPPDIHIYDSQYSAKQLTISDGITYGQVVKRHLHINSTLTIAGDENTSYAWTQRFSMTNDGILKDGANYQNVDAVYEGESTAESSGDAAFYNGFIYPINMTIDQGNDPVGGGFHLKSGLDQGMKSTTTSDTVFSTGLDPYASYIKRKAYGSTVDARRSGSTSYYQSADGKSSVSKAQSEQWFKFGARHGNDIGQDFNDVDVLYQRHVKEDAEVIVRDKETSKGAPDMNKENTKYVPDYSMVGQFAPVPNREKGGTRIFWGKNVEQHQNKFAMPKNKGRPMSSQDIERFQTQMDKNIAEEKAKHPHSEAQKVQNHGEASVSPGDDKSNDSIWDSMKEWSE